MKRNDARKTQFLRVLDGWKIVTVPYLDPISQLEMRPQYIVAPTGRVYRHAEDWELPSLVIDADILPPPHHIKLVRITQKRHCQLVRKRLRKILRLQRKV